MPSDLISVAAARERVLAVTRPLEAEPVLVADAAGRVLSADVVAAGDIPPFSSSAMDGYAVPAGPAGRTYTVIGESRAGTPSELEVGDGQAIRVSTGAAVPACAEAVIRQEDVEEQGELVTSRVDATPGQNIRSAGEVMHAGDLVLASGSLLGPAELGAAVTAGVGEVLARPRPRVQVLCTGDELREPGAPLGPGEIHNSNGPMLVAYARQAGAVAPVAQLLPDQLEATQAALAGALEHADALVVSGGVSVGPHDHVKPALAQLGVGQEFWGVALQPGKPTWFGTREGRLVFGLPGNPVSAAVTFALFVAPALAKLSGRPSRPVGLRQAQLAGDPIKCNRTREQALRVRLEQRDGATLARLNGPQGSHVITSLLGADALALIPPGEGQLEPGAVVALEPLGRYTLWS